MSKLEYRIGSSYDVHAFEEKENSFIVVGGQKINCNYKLVAHSDGDVVFHALSEALLGSLALGDLGLHFPVNDHKYDNYDSSKILTYCYDLVRQKGYVINNVDISLRSFHKYFNKLWIYINTGFNIFDASFESSININFRFSFFSFNFS